MRYSVRYVHKIAPRDTDVMTGIDIPDGAFSNRRTLGAALRHAHILTRGVRISNFRVEGNKVIAFPQACIWHSVILTPEVL